MAEDGNDTSAAQIEALLKIAAAAADLVGFLLPKGEETVAGITWEKRVPIQPGKEIVIEVDQVDDEARVVFNGRKLGVVRGGSTGRWQVPVKAQNKLAVVVVNGGSGAFSGHASVSDAQTKRKLFGGRTQGQDNYVPGGPIYRRGMHWDITAG